MLGSESLTRPGMAGPFRSRGRPRRTVEGKARWRSAHSTGMPAIDAQDDFLRARRAALAARTGRWLARRPRRPNHPPTLSDAAALPTGAAHLEVIALGSIVGTAEPTKSFDARFRPTSGLVRSRWERVALAQRKGVALPPISVLEGPDGYYVVDGRHRVSVARALGRGDIDAWVTRGRSAHWPSKPTPAPAQRLERE